MTSKRTRTKLTQPESLPKSARLLARATTSTTPSSPQTSDNAASTPVPPPKPPQGMLHSELSPMASSIQDKDQPRIGLTVVWLGVATP